jgi:hypothetical protein
MKGHMNQQTRFYLSSATILLIGLGAAAVIYLTAQDVPETSFGYNIAESKQYLRELEIYGGKTNVLAVEFMEWFNGLWQGKTLAYTVGWITIAISAGFCFAAYRWPFHPEVGDPEEGEGESRTEKKR